METKPTERNPIPVSIPASLPHVIKNCNGKSEFFFKEMIFLKFFFSFLENLIFLNKSFDRKLNWQIKEDGQ